MKRWCLCPGQEGGSVLFLNALENIDEDDPRLGTHKQFSSIARIRVYTSKAVNLPVWAGEAGFTGTLRSILCCENDVHFVNLVYTYLVLCVFVNDCFLEDMFDCRRSG